jgi:hypothetical protein
VTSQQNLVQAVQHELQPAAVQAPDRPSPKRWPSGLLLGLLALLVLSPVAAGLTALSLAPPAQVRDVGLDGLSAQIELRIGTNTTQIDSGLLGGLRRPGPTVLGKHVGLDIRPNDLNLTLFTPTGALDSATLDVAGHLFADEQARRDEFTKLTNTVLRYYATVGFGAAYLVAMLEILGYAYLKHRRRAVSRIDPWHREAVLADRRPERIAARVLAVVAMLAVLVPAAYVCSPLSNRYSQVSPDPRLRGTFLAGWQITGPFTRSGRRSPPSTP